MRERFQHRVKEVRERRGMRGGEDSHYRHGERQPATREPHE
jgi:hypothetical protein